MIVVGCDYHSSFQQIAFVDTETGELKEFEVAIMIAVADRRDAWVGLSS
jgi:hypothetical protein